MRFPPCSNTTCLVRGSCARFKVPNKGEKSLRYQPHGDVCSGFRRRVEYWTPKDTQKVDDKVFSDGRVTDAKAWFREGPFSMPEEFFGRAMEGPLSETLPNKGKVDTCWYCGKKYSTTCLERWREHDSDDVATDQYIVLCGSCAEIIIEPHPVLYEKCALFEPIPGVMPQCGFCRHRDGGRCGNPSRVIAVLPMAKPKTQKVFVNYGEDSEKSGVEYWPWEWPVCQADRDVIFVDSPTLPPQEEEQP